MSYMSWYSSGINLFDVRQVSAWYWHVMEDGVSNETVARLRPAGFSTQDHVVESLCAPEHYVFHDGHWMTEDSFFEELGAE